MTPIFGYVSNSADLKKLLGNSPMRFWPFGQAPQPTEQGYGLPYAVHQIVYGAPDNYINQIPDSDNLGVQVDAYGRTPTEADEVMRALRDAIEPRGLVVAYNGEEKEKSTGLCRTGFTVEFWTDH